MKNRLSRLSSFPGLFLFAALSGLAFAPRVAQAQSTSTYGVLQSMPTTNSKSYASLLLYNSKLYGTSSAPSDGTIFSEAEAGGAAVANIHSLSITQGESPYAPLVVDSSGNLYGTAPLGGATSTGGAIFKFVSPYTAAPTRVYGFGASGTTAYGTQPYGQVLLGNIGGTYDGYLYAVCSNAGGSGNFGTIVKIPVTDTGSVAPTVLHTFAGGTTDGATPYGGLVEDANGILYGVTVSGGAYGSGTVFSVTTAGANYTVLHSFGGPGDVAKAPWAGMVLSNGQLYGVTVGGGSAVHGAIYTLSTNGTGYTVLHSFNGTTDGGMSSGTGFAPYSQGLYLAADGNLYGETNSFGSGGGYTTTTSGSYTGGGTVFGLTTSGGSFTTLYAFPASGTGAATAAGSSPGGGLTQDSSTGLLYGTTSLGGTNNTGVVYSITAGLNSAVAVPVVNSDSATIAYGASYTYQITVASGGPITGFGASNLPAWASVNASTGVISATPTASGTFILNLSATNAGGTSTNAATLTLTVNPPVPFATITNPLGLAFNPSALLYCVNFNGYSGAAFTGDVVQIFSNGSTLLNPPFDYNLNHPSYPAFDSSGNLYVTESGTGNVYKITPQGVSTTFASGFNDPIGLAFDASGNLYVAESQSNDIKEVSPSGNVTTFASTGFNVPTGLAFDAAGNLYVTNNSGNTVSLVTPAGAVSQFATGFTSPWQLAFDSKGNLYVANDVTAGTISEVGPLGGAATTFASGITTPTGLAFDAYGDLFVSEFTPSQVIEIQAQPGTFTPPPTPVVNGGTATDVYGSAFGGYSITVSSGTPTSYGASGLPAGLGVSPLTGVISGTPTVGVGTYNVTISATNAVGATGTATLVLTITPAPLTIAASNGSMIYGGAIPVLSVGYNGLVNGDTSASLTTLPTVTTAATSTSSVAGSPYAVTASGAADANYTISYAGGALTVTPATAVLAVTGYSVGYTGSSHLAAAGATGVSGALPLTDFNLGGTVHTNAGTYNGDAWSFADPSGNYYPANGTVNDAITAAAVSVTVTGYNVGYDATAHTATATASWSGGSLPAGDVNLSGTTHTNAGTYGSDAWSFSDASGNFVGTNGTVSDSISQAAATVSVTGYGVTYDGVAHTATGTATGIGGATLSGLVLTGTTHTNAGTYATDPWTFVDPAGNYANSTGTVSDSIAQATATVSVTGYSVTYDGSAHTATGTAAGVSGANLGGDLTLSGTTHTGAGTYGTDAWTFTDPTGNYSTSSGTVIDAISKANATVSVTGYSVTYDGSVHTATGTATGVGSAALSGLVLTGTTHTNAGTYATDPWTFTDVTGNYNSTSGTASDSISKANATVSVTGYSVTYDGTAHTATGTATGAGGVALSGLVLTGTTHTNAGTYATDPWTFTDATGNYNSTSGTASDAIAQATATVNVTGYSLNYDGNSHTAAGTATGAAGANLGSDLTLSRTTHTNAGTYATDAWTFADPTGNYKAATGTVSDTISKANATVSVTGYSVTYDGSAHTATGTATGAGGAALSGLVLTGTTHTNAGTYATDPWTFTDATGNYNSSSGTASDAIAQAPATVAVNSLTVTYDGSAHAVTAATTPSGLSMTLTYGGSPTAPTSAGSYPVVATITDPNYTGSGTGTLLINKATPVIVWSNPADIIFGTALSSTQLNATSATPGTFAYTPAPGALLNAGPSQPLAVTLTPTDTTDYNSASATVAINVNFANATVTLGNLLQVYDGTAKTATATTNPGNLAVLLAYNGVPAVVTPVTGGIAPYAAATGQTIYVNATGDTSGAVYGSGPYAINSDIGAAAVQAGILTSGQTAVLQVNILADQGNYTASTQNGVTSLAEGAANGSFQIVGIATTGYTFGPVQAGSTPVTATIVDFSYAGSTSGTLVITPVTPVLSWTQPADIASGTALGGTQLDATASVAGSFAYTPTSGTVLNVGPNQPLNAVFTPTDTVDYVSGGTVATTINVIQTAATITLPNVTQTYTGSPIGDIATTGPSGLTVTYVYTGTGGTVYGPSATPPTGAGSYAVTATIGDPSYTGSATATITISPATPVLAWGAETPITYGTALSGIQLDATASVAGSFAYAPVSGTVLNAGPNQALNAVFTPTDTVDYTSGGAVATTITVTKGAGTVTLPNVSQTYTGSPIGDTGTTGPSGLTLVYCYTGTGGTVYGPSATPPTGAGTYTVTATINNPNDTGTATATITIGKATPVLAWGAETPITYGTALGGTQLDATASVTGTFAYTPASGTVLNVGPNQALNAVFTPTDTADYTSGGTVATTITVTKATATVTLPNVSQTYTGSPIGDTGTTGPSGLTLVYCYTGTGGTVYGPSATPPTGAGTYTVTATINNPNDTGTATATITIGKATPVLAWGAETPITYGTALGGTQLDATASVTGTFAYTPAAGTVLSAGPNQVLNAVFTPTDTADYISGGTVATTITVTKVAATVTLPNVSQTYTGSPVGDTGTTGPSGLTLVYCYTGTGGTVYGPSATPPTGAGTYTVTATINNPNDTGTATATITIGKATPVLSWGAETPINYGTALSATQLDATASVAGTFAYTPASGTVLNAGPNQALKAVFTPTDTTDYTSGGTVATTITVNPCKATVTVASATVAYNGSPHSLTATTAPTGLTVTLTYNGSATAPTTAGTYAVVGTISNANDTGTGTGTLIISKATPALAWTAPAAINYGTALSGTQLDATASVAGSFVYTPAAGTVLNTGSGQALNAVFTPTDTTDYTSGGTVATTITVNKCTATVTVASATVTYNGSPHSVTATTTPTGLTVTLTYNGSATAPTAAGTYAVVGTVTSANDTGTGTGTLIINKATPVLAWTAPAAINYGTALSGTQLDATASVAGGFAYTPAAGTVLNAGAGQALNAVFTPTDTTDYVSGGTVATTITVNKVTATIALGSLTQTYSGSPESVTATTTPAGLSLTYVYTGTGGTSYGPSATPPTAAGKYTVVATISGPNDSGTATGTLTITPAVLTVTAANATITAGQAIPTLGYTITGYVGGDTVGTALTGTPTLTTTAKANSAIGTYPITAAKGSLASANYTFTFVNGTLTINSAAECLVWLQGHCGNQTNCNGGRGYNGCDGYGSLGGYCGSGGYSSSACNQTVTGGTVVPIAFALYNCSNNNYSGGSNYGSGCSGAFVADTSTVISISELNSNGTLSNPVIYGYSATGPNPPNFWILNNEYLLNFPTASGSHDYCIEVYHTQTNGSLLLLGSENLYTSSSCLPSSCANGSKFNGTSIARGDTVWFSSVVNVSRLSSQTSTLVFDSSTIAFTANGSSVTLNVPAATIKFDPAATAAATTYSSISNSWSTVVPAGYTGNVFLTGVGYPVTQTIYGGVGAVTWNGTFRSDCSGNSAQWKWSAAAYTQFNANPALLGVKPVDSSTLSQYNNSDLAGTPESYKQYVTAGACGTGGSNYTGTYGSSCSPSIGSSCWTDSCSFYTGWGYGSYYNSSYNICSGGGWGNGGNGNYSCGNGGDGNCDGGWGAGWDNGGNYNCNYGW